MVNFSGAKTDATANESAPAPNDQSLTKTATGNSYLCPYDAMVVGAYAFNDSITRAQVVYPSIRDLGYPEVFPVNVLAIPSASFYMEWWGQQAPRITKNEELGMQSSNGTSTVDIINCGLWLSTMIDPIPSGRRFTVRGTAAQTLVANQYTSASIALDQTLPFGRYGVIGMEVTCAAAVAARLIFPQNASIRPGVIVGNTISVHNLSHRLRSGSWGLLGTFEQTSPPQLEILGTTAGAQTPAVVLDLIAL